MGKNPTFSQKVKINKTPKSTRAKPHKLNQQKWVKRAKNRLKVKNTRGDPYQISKTSKNDPKTLVFREFAKPQISQKRSKKIKKIIKFSMRKN